MGFRLIASDIDGTLLNNDHQLSTYTINTIRELIDNGYIFTLATGRMYRSAKIIADKLDLDVPLITYNGSLVKMSKSNEILYQRFISNESAKTIVKSAVDHGSFIIHLYIDDNIYTEAINEYSMTYSNVVSVPITPIGDVLSYLGDKKPTTILILGEPAELDDFARTMNQLLGDSVCMVSSKPYFLEFTHIQGDKGLGLEAVMDYFNIDKEETLVFGDSPNDYRLFQCCGYGVAVENADESIKAVADEVGLSNHDNGVADGIMRLVLNPKK